MKNWCKILETENQDIVITKDNNDDDGHFIGVQIQTEEFTMNTKVVCQSPEHSNDLYEKIDINTIKSLFDGLPIKW